MNMSNDFVPEHTNVGQLAIDCVCGLKENTELSVPYLSGIWYIKITRSNILLWFYSWLTQRDTPPSYILVLTRRFEGGVGSAIYYRSIHRRNLYLLGKMHMQWHLDAIIILIEPLITIALPWWCSNSQFPVTWNIIWKTMWILLL